MTKLIRFNQFTLPAFCVFILSLLPLALVAQEAPVSVSFTPPDGWEEGDEIEMIIDYGSEEVPLNNITEVQFEIEMPEGTTLAISSELEVTADGSWFAYDNAWTGSAEITNDGYSVIVTLGRTNGRPASGQGEVARVKGLIVEVAEIIWKGEVEGNARVSSQLQSQERHLEFDMVSKQVSAKDLPEGAIIQLMDATGRILLTGTAAEGLDLSGLTSQYYIAVVKNQAQYLEHITLTVLP